MAELEIGVLPDLIALTERDPNWTWDGCICCGSPKVTHRALFIRATDDGVWEVSRIAWCGNDKAEDGERWGCQGDRRRAVNVIYVGADGLTRPSTQQAELCEGATQ